MKKIILKTGIFILVLLAILVILSAILVPKNNSEEAGMKESQAMGILGEGDNTIDVVMYGDSETIASTMPMRIWKNHGISMHVCGAAGQTLPDTCRIVYKTLKKQKPKIVILETNNLFTDTSITVPMARVLNELLPITEYHNRWKSLKKEDFFGKINYTATDINKGYYYVGNTDPADDSNYMTYSEEKEPIPRKNKMYVKILKEYCKAKGSEFVLVSVPSCKNWNYKKHNSVKELAEKENIEFLDLNERHEEINIDWKTETGDKGDHVNYKGAQKVSDYIGNWLNKKNILENHKNDEKYKKWNEDLKNCHL